MEKLTLANIIESIVFVSGNSIAIKDIAEKLEVTDKEVNEAAKLLQAKYGGESGLNLLIFNKKLQFCSNPAYAEQVSAVLNPIRERELSKSMLEVAAIIAYKQPVTRLDLEEIRGVDSEYAIQNLLKLGVIEVVGRKDAVGRPVLFGTTDGFLKRFQISSLKDLPSYEELLGKLNLLKTNNNYLFSKAEYDESTDPEMQSAFVTGENLQQQDGFGDDLYSDAESNVDVFADDESFDLEDDIGEDEYEADDMDEDFELSDVEDEEMPDFLEDEDDISKY